MGGYCCLPGDRAIAEWSGSFWNIQHPMKDQQTLPGRARHSPRHRMSGSVRAVRRCTASRAIHHARGGQGTARPTHEPGNIEHPTSNEGKEPSPHPDPLPSHPSLYPHPVPFHEPDGQLGSARTCPRFVSTRHVASRKAATCRRTPRRCRGNWFMVPMHAKGRKEALHEPGKRGRPPHPGPLPQGGEGEVEPQAPLRSGVQSAILSGKSPLLVVREGCAALELLGAED